MTEEIRFRVKPINIRKMELDKHNAALSQFYSVVNSSIFELTDFDPALIEKLGVITSSDLFKHWQRNHRGGCNTCELEYTSKIKRLEASRKYWKHGFFMLAFFYVLISLVLCFRQLV